MYPYEKQEIKKKMNHWARNINCPCLPVIAPKKPLLSHHTGLTPMRTNSINNKYKTLQLFEIDD